RGFGSPDRPSIGRGFLRRATDVRGLEPLGPPADLELDPIPFGQALEALSLDGAEVHEHVLATLLGDEAVPLRIVEPLDRTLSHLYLLFLRGSYAPVIPRHHDGAPSRYGGQTKNAAGPEVLAASRFTICTTGDHNL